jgi:hypothetical protein
MLVYEHQQRVVEHRARALGDRLQLAHQVGELLHVPAADVAQDSLALGAGGARSLAVLVGVVVVARAGVAQPREPRQSLALGEHVAGDARLARGEGVGQQVALHLGHARPVLHVEVLPGGGGGAVLGRQRGDGPLQVAHRRQVLVQPGRIVGGQALAEKVGVGAHCVQDAALPLDPAMVLRSEQPVEQAVGNLLRRQRSVGPGPAHVLLHRPAERLLRHADLQGPEALPEGEPPGHDLVERRSARPATGEPGAGHERAHRRRMAVEGCVDDGRIVQAADDVDVVAKAGQGGEARRQVVVCAGAVGNPVALGDAVAVEPEDEPAVGPNRSGGVGRAVGVEHRHQRGEPHRDGGPGGGEPLQEQAPGYPSALGDYVGHMLSPVPLSTITKAP